MTHELKLQGRSHLTPEFSQDLKDASEAPKIADYLDDLSELSLTYEQKLELFRVLHSIMRSFVEMGFNIDICAYLFSDFLEASRAESDISYSTEPHNDEVGKE